MDVFVTIRLVICKWTTLRVTGIVVFVGGIKKEDCLYYKECPNYLHNTTITTTTTTTCLRLSQGYNQGEGVHIAIHLASIA